MHHIACDSQKESHRTESQGICAGIALHSCAHHIRCMCSAIEAISFLGPLDSPSGALLLCRKHTGFAVFPASRQCEPNPCESHAIPCGAIAHHFVRLKSHRIRMKSGAGVYFFLNFLLHWNPIAWASRPYPVRSDSSKCTAFCDLAFGASLTSVWHPQQMT